MASKGAYLIARIIAQQTIDIKPVTALLLSCQQRCNRFNYGYFTQGR